MNIKSANDIIIIILSEKKEIGFWKGILILGCTMITVGFEFVAYFLTIFSDKQNAPFYFSKWLYIKSIRENSFSRHFSKLIAALTPKSLNNHGPDFSLLSPFRMQGQKK